MDDRCFVIAEAGVNHNGSLDIARRMVLAARDAGADAVKFQTFCAEALVTADSPKAAYQAQATGTAESQLEMLKGLELGFDAFRELYDACGEAGIEFMSTPFDKESAEFLNKLGMVRFKIPSGEVTNTRLLNQVASFGKPMIVSTGMCTMDDIEAALGSLRAINKVAPIWLLQCVSAYPASAEDMNLRAMATMRERFKVPVGLSDHTAGIAVSVGAASLGAVAIEKHFTLDRGMKGPDHKASLEPDELRNMIASIREVQTALGDGVKQPTAEELEIAAVARRSIVAARDLDAGTVLTENDMDFKRPGTGIDPRRSAELVGRVLIKPVRKDGSLEWELLR